MPSPETAIPRLILTPGEPAGIGPDLAVRLVQEALPAALAVAGDPDLLRTRAARLGMPLRLIPFDPAMPTRPWRPGDALAVVAVPLARPARPGHLDPANAGAVLAALDRACALCLDGTCAALVTGPVHKGVINEAGWPFSGHTEYLAARCGGDPLMLLTAPGLRVALATTHLPLRAVSDAIDAERIERVLCQLHAGLRQDFGLAEPRILVCGLNPHAGEGGHLGHEERERIAPAIERLRARGWRIEGPVPADTAFVPASLARQDAVLAMYHDQGLTVLKHLGFGQAVNVTLGLPIVRTSVDHGTALDLAGTDRADLGSLRAAVHLAIELAARRRARPTGG